jgi:hypothetical protein
MRQVALGSALRIEASQEPGGAWLCPSARWCSGEANQAFCHDPSTRRCSGVPKRQVALGCAPAPGGAQT